MMPADRSAWVVSLDANAYQKSVLFVLAHRADAKSGRCWPSMVKLAKESGMSVRKAREVIRDLQMAGLIDVAISIGKSSNRYFVKFGTNPAQPAALEESEPGTAFRVTPPQPGTTRKPTRHSVPINPAQRADRTGNSTGKRKGASPTVWDIGESLLGSRPMVGKLIGRYGEEAVAKALAVADLKRPADPRSYIIGILNAQQPQEVRRAASDW